MCARHTTMHCQHISICQTNLDSSLYQLQVFFAYIAAFLGYMFIRITKTLALGNYFVYGLFVLGVEILGATTTIIYGAQRNHEDAMGILSRRRPGSWLLRFTDGTQTANLAAISTSAVSQQDIQAGLTAATPIYKWDNNPDLAASTNLLFRPVNLELDRLKAAIYDNPNGNSILAAGTNLLFRPVNPELDRLKARKGKDAQLPVSDSASVKSGLDGDMSVAGDLEEGGVGKVGNHGATPGDVLYI
jgi:hypothetical protein